MDHDGRSRRGVLALAAGALGASAGCLSVFGTDGGERAMGETASGGGKRVTVSNPRVQHTFVYDNGVWREVMGEGGNQFLVVDVDAEGFDRAWVSLFDVAVDGERLDVDAHAVTGDAEVVDGPVAFPVPVASADEAAVVWKRTVRPAVRWRVPADSIADFAHAPEFRVRDVTFTAEDGLGVAVENAGDRDGTFRLRISAAHVYDISHVATWAVPAGDTVTRRVPTDELSSVDSEGGVTLELDWGTGSMERTFESTTP